MSSAKNLLSALWVRAMTFFFVFFLFFFLLSAVTGEMDRWESGRGGQYQACHLQQESG